MSRSLEDICIDLMNENESKDDIINSLIKENERLRKELEDKEDEQLRKELQELKDKEDDRK